MRACMHAHACSSDSMDGTRSIYAASTDTQHTDRALVESSRVATWLIFISLDAKHAAGMHAFILPLKGHTSAVIGHPRKSDGSHTMTHILKLDPTLAPQGSQPQRKKRKNPVSLDLRPSSKSEKRLLPREKEQQPCCCQSASAS
jgi:hypothetical protein